MIKMYAMIYFNFTGGKEEFEEAEKTLKDIANKTKNLELLDILVPSSEWNYAALVKFDRFQTFTDYIKKTREEPLTFFAKRGLHPPPKKLEIFVEKDHLE
jgi:hypothetical protein